MAFERLEDRALLSSVPFGAAPDDTAEFMLGDVLVTVVLMESVGQNSTEDWTVGAIHEVQQRVVEGLGWWQDTLAVQHPSSPHALSFQYDWTYAGGEYQDASLTDVVSTEYEPIANISDAFQHWMYDFLDVVGYSTGDFSSDIRALNHAQRLAHNTDWAFTVFVVNDENDPDGEFRCDNVCGTFTKAFAFPGGQFYVTPAGRPASTHAHEAGHIFWAKDEYAGAGSYTDRRGYYNTQNLNHANNPAPGFVQAESIMARGNLLSDAYSNHTSSEPSLQMIGWRDLDGDGIFDLLDVPLTLTGSGFVDPEAAEPTYRFVGSSSVQTMLNQNSSGLRNDITINEVSRAEYRIDGGEWQTGATFDANTYTADLDLQIELGDSEFHTVEIRTVDDTSGMISPVFQGDTTTAASVMEQGIYGFVWNDQDDNGQFDPGESGLPGWTVRMVSAEGEPLDPDSVEPDKYSSYPWKLDDVNPEVTLSAIGVNLDGSVYAFSGGYTSTGAKVFGYFVDSSFNGDEDGPGKAWTSESRKLKMDFHPAVTSVSLDAIGDSIGDYARLDVYSAGGQLLDRYTTGQLGIGDVETMTVSRSTPDIEYAIAHGHAGSEVRFDNLRFGPDTNTTTDSSGAYALTNLAAGTYHVEAVAPGSQDPLPQQQEVTLAEGEAVGSINFDGQTASWRNPGDPADVNDDQMVTPLDALLLINYINNHLDDLSVPPPPAEPPPYYDVDGNGFVTALDVLYVIDVLNGLVAGESVPQSGQSGGGFGEGESAPANLARISQELDEPDDQASDSHEPIVTMPFVGTNDLTPVPSRSESLAVSTPASNAVVADRSGSWRTAADDYFQEISLAENELDLAVGQAFESASDLDEILPDITVEFTKLTDAFAASRV